MKSTRSACASGRAGRCSETTTAHGSALDEVEERLGGRRVELRRRLVEQQQLRPQRERRREADALQLAARQLAVTARSARCSAPTSASASSTRGQISAGSTPRFSSPNATSFATRLITTWSSGSWKTDATVPGELARAASRACRARRRRRGPRRRRRGSAARARRARAAASTCPSPDGAEQRDVLAVARSAARRRRSTGAPPRVGEAELVDASLEPQRPHDDDRDGQRRARRGRAAPTAGAAPASARRGRSRAPPSPRRG